MLPTITTVVGRLGLARLFGPDLYPQIHPEGRFLPPETRRLMLLQAAQPAYVDQVISAIESATASDAELNAAGAGSLGARPVIVVSTEQYLALYPGWRTGQDALAALSTNSQHWFAGPGSEHYIAWQQPELAIAAVDQVVDAVRSGQGR
jgi:hypothetical protein